MSDSSKITFNQICNTAILRSGAMTNKNAFELLENLATTLIEHEKYESFAREKFSEDFYDFYHLKLPPIVLGEVLSRLSSKKLLKKKEKDLFVVDSKEALKINSLNELESFAQERNILVTCLQDYLNKHGIKSNRENAELILTKHIEDSLSILGDPSNKNIQLDTVEQFLVDSFVKELRNNDDNGYYSIYKKILFGRLLAAFIVNNSSTLDTTITILDKLVLYLDTGVVFSVLGLDNYSTKNEYLDMINTLQGLGAKIKLLAHVYEEVYDIIDGSKYWINNHQLYSPASASRVSEYFISNKYSSEDIDEYLLNLEDRFKELDIEIEDYDINYNEVDQFGLYEENIFNKIKNQYLLTGGYQENKEDTYRIDARSIYSIHKMRRGRRYRKLNDAGFILLTTNKGIAKVARECTVGGTNTIAYAITDAYLSMLLFLAYPNYSDETNMRFLIPAAYHAFRPSKELLAKMENVLRDLNNRGVMSESQVFSWISNITLGEEVLAITNNNPELFDDSTPERVMNKIKEEASIKIAESKEEAKDQINKANAQAEETLEKYFEAEKARKQLVDQLNRKDKEELAKLQSEKKRLETKATSKIKWNSIIYFVLSLMLIAAICTSLAFLADSLIKTEKSRWISYLISSLITIVLSLMSFRHLWIACNWLAIKTVKTKKQQSRVKELSEKIDSLDKEISNRK